MYNIAIVDDDKHDLDYMLESIQELIIKYQINAKVFSILNSNEIPNIKFDLYFLDIDMPKQSGIDLAKTINQEENPIIVFVTNKSNLVFQSFAAHPFSFIRKEYFYNEIETVFLQCIEKLKSQNPYIILKTVDHGYQSIHTNLILYFESFNHYCLINTKKDCFKVWMPLNKIKSLFNPSDFFQINRSIVVNWKHVETIKNKNIILDNNLELNISKLYLKSAKESFKNYHLKKI